MVREAQLRAPSPDGRLLANEARLPELLPRTRLFTTVITMLLMPSFPFMVYLSTTSFGEFLR